MNAVLVDTNVIIDAFLGDRAAAAAMASYDRVIVCTTVLGEYKAGIQPNTKSGANFQSRMEDFLDDPAVQVIGGTETTSDYYARIYRELKAKGKPIPQNDMWIAAFALEHAATLLSRDTHFSEIPMLKWTDLVPTP